MLEGEPPTPQEYLVQYLAWREHMNVSLAILFCRCGKCAVCKIQRPLYLHLDFEKGETNEERDSDDNN